MSLRSLLAIAILLISSAHGSVPPIVDDDCGSVAGVQRTRNQQGYTVSISRNLETACSHLNIDREGARLYHEEEVDGHFEIGSEWQSKVLPFSSLTGRGSSNLIVSDWTGGAHCCFSLRIFDLKNFGLIDFVEGGNFYPLLEDLDRDGIPEIRISDDFLNGIYSSFSETATGDVILKYSKGSSYRVAANLMKKSLPRPQVLLSKARKWRRAFQKQDYLPDAAPKLFIQDVTDLTFSGRKDAAMKLINMSWPQHLSGKEKFVKDYEKALSRSKYYPEFERELEGRNTPGPWAERPFFHRLH